jgi:O-methyltransferase involved in polyketide biosynthesis
MTHIRAVAFGVGATLLCTLASLWVASSAPARLIPDPPTTDTSQLIAPPPAETTTGTSPWWFVLVAVAAVLATLLVIAAANAIRSWRPAPSFDPPDTGGEIHVDVY